MLNFASVKRLLLILSLFLLGLAPLPALAQIVSLPGEELNADSIKQDFENQPYFGLYKDNYFVFGPPLGKKANSHNTNIKFQISVAQRLTKSTLPWGTYLYLFYTQKVFWNVLENSMPMTDLNFNPGIGLAKPLFVHDRYIGKLTFVIEHESNGRDGDESRSWNKISLGGSFMIDPNLMVHGKFWIPIVDGMNNKDILRYSGIYQMGMQVMSRNRRFNGAITLVKRKGWNLNYNTIVELGMRMWKDANEYFFIQYYNGYGEGLLDYKVFQTQIRFGIQIKPKLFSDY